MNYLEAYMNGGDVGEEIWNLEVRQVKQYVKGISMTEQTKVQYIVFIQDLLKTMLDIRQTLDLI
jgi:hypothetical protein